jgi:hypothetical protein
MILHITAEQADEFAIGALEPDLEQAVRLHIMGCVECSALVDDALLVAAHLALTAPPRPAPQTLRRNVMVAAGIASPRLAARLTSMFQAAAGIAAVSIAVAALAGMLMTRNQLQDLREENNDLQVRIDDIDSAEVEIFALTQRLANAEQLAAQMRRDASLDNELMAAIMNPNSQTAEVTTIRGNASLGRLIWEPDQSRVWFVAQRLPRLAENETYQLWMQSPSGEYVSAGNFNSDESGAVIFRRFIGEGITSYSAAVVTREVSGADQKQGPSVFFVADLNRR